MSSFHFIDRCQTIFLTITFTKGASTSLILLSIIYPFFHAFQNLVASLGSKTRFHLADWYPDRQILPFFPPPEMIIYRRSLSNSITSFEY